MPVVAIKIGHALTPLPLELNALVDFGEDSLIIPVLYLGQIRTRKERIVWMRTVTGRRSVVGSHHTQSSVGPYLRDYERVKELIKNHLPIARIPRLLDMQPAVVDAYVKLLDHYSLERFDRPTLEA